MIGLGNTTIKGEDRQDSLCLQCTVGRCKKKERAHFYFIK